MAKLKEITLGGSYTFQAAPYTPVKGEAQVTMALEEGDNVEDVQVQAAQLVTENVIAMLAGINVIHDKIHNKSYSVEDLVGELDGKEIVDDWEDPDDDSPILPEGDDDWKID